jgi:hypothetical protein
LVDELEHAESGKWAVHQKDLDPEVGFDVRFAQWCEWSAR